MKCKNCKFFNRRGEVFECRRFPPQVCTETFTDRDGNITSNDFQAFPDVSLNDWCGEYKNKYENI